MDAPTIAVLVATGLALGAAGTAVVLALKLSAARVAQATTAADLELRRADLATARKAIEDKDTAAAAAADVAAQLRRDHLADLEELRHALESCRTPDAQRALFERVLERARTGGADPPADAGGGAVPGRGARSPAPPVD